LQVNKIYNQRFIEFNGLQKDFWKIKEDSKEWHQHFKESRKSKIQEEIRNIEERMSELQFMKEKYEEEL